MNQTKFWLGLLVATVLAMVTLETSAMEVTRDGITWSYVVDESWDALIYNSIGNSAVTNSISGVISIPSHMPFTSYPVTQIGPYAFWRCKKLTEVKIPDTVKVICNFAFGECSGLTNIFFPNSVLNLQSDAFSDCRSLKSIVIPSSVVSLADRAFANCTGLTNVAIAGGSGSWFTKNVFSGCTNLQRIAFSSSHKTFESEDGVWFYKGKKELYFCPFGKNGSYDIPDGVTNILSEAFSDCKCLISVTIPSSVIGIGRAAFSGCSGLTSVVIGSRVETIGAGAFHNCQNLSSVTIPARVRFIGTNVFSSCYDLESIEVAAGNTQYESIGGVLYDKTQKTLLCYPSGKKGFYEIPDGVKGIARDAFSWCAVTSLFIPDSVTNIPLYAFSSGFWVKSARVPGWVVNSSRLSKIFPDNYDTISEVEIGNGATRIGDSVFSGCSNLTTVLIPNRVNSIATNAFSRCGHLESLEIPEWVASSSRLATVFPEHYRRLQSVTIGNGATDIGNDAFINCTALRSVTIPESVTSIGDEAFYACSCLDSISIPTRVTYIGEKAFLNCSGLRSMTIPTSVTNIGDKVFDGCSGLETLVVPASWKGTDMLANAAVPTQCTVVYGVLGTERLLFDPNGGRCNTASRDYSVGAAYEWLPVATRTHCTFAGWWTEVESGEQITTETLSSSVGQKTLYAHWAFEEQEVTFDANGGWLVSGGMSSSTRSDFFAVGKPYGRLPEPSREHFAFGGWWTSAEGGEHIDSASMVPATGTRTLYAHWTPVEQVVVFDANGGACDTTNRTYSVGGAYSPLPEASLEKYSFAGWWTAASGGERVLATDTVTATESRTLYAHWVPINQEVTFYANGGVCDTTNRTYAVGGTYSPLPAATFEHYAFAGWWTSSKGGEQVQAADTVTEQETRMLYAHWNLAEQVVTFAPNGGTCDTTGRVYAIDGKYSPLPKAMREGYAFAGWFTAETGGDRLSEASAVTAEEYRTFYAHWTLTEQVVAFNANGGICDTASHVYAVGDVYGWLPEATRADGVVFAGWCALTATGWERIKETGVVTAERSRELWAVWGDGVEDAPIHLSGFLPNTETGGFQIEFNGTEGKTYALQRTRKLEGTAIWTTVGTLEADQFGTLSMVAKTPPGWDKGFYRVVEPGSGLELPQDIYLVFDLLGGGDDDSTYPMSFLVGEPQGGWTDEYKTTKLVLRRIPAGTFTMGSPSGEAGRETSEKQHEVTISQPFYIGVFEVTQKQWELVMGTRPSYFENALYYEKRPVERVSYNDIRGSSAGAGWPANAEVDATSFMGRLRGRTGGCAFDLPTEAQWEYACRAGTTTALNSGKDLTDLYQCTNMAEVGRYYYNGRQQLISMTLDTSAGTAEVGSYRPNAWGLYDMHGNVCEWCLDWWQRDLGDKAAVDPVGAASGTSRVRRGGGWRRAACYARSAYRQYYDSPSSYNDFVGFRLAMILPE